VPYLGEAVELGRSFVQPRYWGSRALDYLWHGIGAYLAQNPRIRWMFGPVSIPNSYPKSAKDLLVYFYLRHFGDDSGLALPQQRYELGRNELEELKLLFRGESYASDFRVLKEQLAHYDVSVPTLFKQYTELCEDGGVRFLGFNIDPNFGHCVDGLILVDVRLIKSSKWERYVKMPTAAKAA